MKQGFTLLETIIMVIGIVLLSLAIVGTIHKECNQMPAAYFAWAKQTDNPKKLTYNEWRALMRCNTRLVER